MPAPFLSRSIVDSADDLSSRGRSRWTENCKVYTRKILKKSQKNINNNSTATASTSTPTLTEVSSLKVAAATADGVKESVGALVAENADSSQRKPQEQASRQEDIPSRNIDSSTQQNEERLQNCSSQTQVQEGSGSQAPGLQNLEDFPLHSANQLLRTSGKGSLNIGESSPLSSENDLPNGSEFAAAHLPIGFEPQNDGELVSVPLQIHSGNVLANANGVVKPLVISNIDDRVRFHLSKETPENEIMNLKKKLECELDQVKNLAKQLEAKQLQFPSHSARISNSGNYLDAEGGNSNLGGYSHTQPQTTRTDVAAKETRPMGLARVSSDIGAPRNLEPRPYSRQLSVAVMNNNHMSGEFVEKEKRTPKANQYYRNSEFLLGKDRLPPESTKRMKTNSGRKHSHAFNFGFNKSRNQAFKSCNSLLQKLMKHQHGWVFNEPVNAKALGLRDYHDIITHPMDLGMIKSRLSQNSYKSLRDFAEDVRLVFRNAMTYNPKGQDVHVMAEQLSQIFEERWAVIESEYNPYWMYQMYIDAGLPTPNSQKAPPKSHFAPDSVPITVPMAVDHKIQRPYHSRTPVPKKPKAKDLNKRDMTYEEKQRLSTNLQSLPVEKLDSIVQIIKRRDTALSQHDDEIEVDIDRVDPETLWDLDRFVTNYKKSLSKNKRKAELARARTAADQILPLTNATPAVGEVQFGSGTALEKSSAPPAVEGDKQEYNGSRSSSSSSSSSDSGSSSSDSDSESSSSDESDEGNSSKKVPL